MAFNRSRTQATGLSAASRRKLPLSREPPSLARPASRREAATSLEFLNRVRLDAIGCWMGLKT